jgi:hypothetical protein
VLFLVPFPSYEKDKENAELHKVISKHTDMNVIRKLTTTKRAIMTGSFHSLETPPHWRGRRREVIIPTERTLPTQSMRSHFSHVVLPVYSVFSGGGLPGKKSRTTSTDYGGI